MVYYNAGDSKNYTYNTEIYWALNEGNALGGAILEKVNNYYNYCRAAGKLQSWQNCYNQYYLNTRLRGQKYKTGKNNEYTVINNNQYKAILENVINMLNQNDPAFETHGINTDHKTNSQVILAKQLLEYYADVLDLRDVMRKATMDAYILGEGWVLGSWQQSDGDIYALSPDGTPLQEGDIRLDNLSPLDVIRETSHFSDNNNDWFIARTFRNKWVMINSYPNMATELKNAPMKASLQNDLIFNQQFLQYTNDHDNIILYELYHKPNSILPNGLMAVITGDGKLIKVGPLPYDNIPLFKMFAKPQTQTNFGDTPAIDMLGLQQMLDTDMSVSATNIVMTKVKNFVAESGSGVSASDMLGSGQLITVPQGSQYPQVLNTGDTDEGVMNHAALIETAMTKLAGINEVARGFAQEKNMSGASMALLQANAIQSNSYAQNSHKQLLEALGEFIVETLKKFANNPRQAEIVGVTNQSYMKEFVGDDINKVSRVTVKIGSPLLQTTSGKMELAQQLLQMGQIQTPKQFINLIETGDFETMLAGTERELQAIKAENEVLMNGGSAIAVWPEDHITHINEHKSVMLDPEAKKNPTLIQNVMNHIEEHIMLLSDPKYIYYNQINKQTPLPPPQMMMAQPGGIAGPSPSGTAPGAPPEGKPPVGDAISGVRQPSMPTNPSTGQAPTEEGVLTPIQ